MSETANTPELELLLLCASPAKSDSQRVRIRESAGMHLNWGGLQNLAEWHRLMPQLYWELKSLCPETVSASLEERFQANLRNNLLLTTELVRALDLFARAGIPAIPFKGPTLAIQAYGNLALRSFDDLDILVRPADVWRARDLLLCEGYRMSQRVHPLREPAWLRSYDEVVLHGANGLILELHWALIPPHFSVSLDTAAFHARAEKVLLGNRSVAGLAPEDLLLVLCLHGAKHCWSHLGLIGDVGRLIARYDFLWPSILRRAREAGMHRIVLLAAALASTVLGVTLAEPLVLEIRRDSAIPALVCELVSELFAGHEGETSLLRTVRFHLRMRERLRDRISYAFRLITRPGIEDWQVIDLPRPLSFLYSIVRFPRLAWKYGSRLP